MTTKTDETRLVAAFGRPSRKDRVAAEHDDERWFGVHADVKAYHMVGRTLLGRRCVYRHVDVQALADDVGFDPATVWNWSALGVSQKIDVIATELLRRDRDGRVSALRQAGSRVWERDILSVGQWMMRTTREIPTPLGGMEALLEFSGHARMWRP